MGKLYQRLERIEAATNPPKPWEAVCSYCRAEGLKSTPYEHCEAKRCNEGRRAVEALAPDHVELIRKSWEDACRFAGQDPTEETRKALAEDAAKREAWRLKKQPLALLQSPTHSEARD